jgi:hypothetical protein
MLLPNEDVKKFLQSFSKTIEYLFSFHRLSSEAGQILGLKKSDGDLAWKIGVSSDGTATFNFPGSIYGQCSLTISDYPYDEHRCSFVFASWVHDGSELILKLRPDNPLDLGNYVFNNEWHIVGTEAKAIEERYECCPAPFYMTSFNIHVRRGASSYVSNYIIPSILIAILSIMMFTLPPEVGKRMGEYSNSHFSFASKLICVKHSSFVFLIHLLFTKIHSQFHQHLCVMFTTRAFQAGRSGFNPLQDVYSRF